MLTLWYKYVTGSILRIQKRLGGALCKEIIALVDESIAEQKRSGNKERHKAWVAMLLKDYCDPMYSYQLANNKDKIIFKGDENAILQYIKDAEKDA